MSIGNLPTQGDKKNNWTWQNSVLQLLGAIESGISGIPGVDYETRTTTYQATAGGPGYSLGDIIVRYDIISVPTGTVTSTVWFNQTTQAIIAAPAPGNITPYLPPGNVTVTNPFNLEATQVLIRALLTTIDADTSNLDVLLSTRNAEATQLLVKAKTDNLDVALSTLLSTIDFQARINTLGQKAMTASTPVVLASDQSSIPVTLPAGISRVPSVQIIAANTALANTTAGVKQLSMRVSGANGQIGGRLIPNGITLTFTATSENDTVGSVSYQTGVGSTILITYLT